MNHILEIKIMITLGYAIGVIEGVLNNDISSELSANLENARDRLVTDVDQIMKEFEKDF